MWRKKLLIYVSLVVFVFSDGGTFADCPSADLTGDCFVDFEDFALMANQWLITDPCVPDDMVYIPDGEFEVGRHVGDGASDELPIHTVHLDAFFMSKHEITNQQYCDYLNSAHPAQLKEVGGIVYAASDSVNSYPYCDTNSYDTESQIDFIDPNFSVRTKDGRDMSNDPMVEVSWYGAVAYCNWRSSQEGYQQLYDPCDPNWPCDFSKHGYRLQTEAEWEYTARGGENSPYYRFPWGDTISHSQANYYASGGYVYDLSDPNGYHPDWDDGYPYTSVVGSFSANGYGLYDMAGNVWEWCNDWYDSDYYTWCKNTCGEPCPNPQGPASGSARVLRGGSWGNFAFNCRVAHRYFKAPDSRDSDYGFRIVLDLN